MSETTFENAKIGDRVYSPLYACKNAGDKTNAVIVEIGQDVDEEYEINVKPDVEPTSRESHPTMFCLNGHFFKFGGQVLFWENPILEIPTRPKRKVVKTGWIGVRPMKEEEVSSFGWIATTTAIFENKEDVFGLGITIQPIQYEVEE